MLIFMILLIIYITFPGIEITLLKIYLKFSKTMGALFFFFLEEKKSCWKYIFFKNRFLVLSYLKSSWGSLVVCWGPWLDLAFWLRTTALNQSIKLR